MAKAQTEKKNTRLKIILQEKGLNQLQFIELIKEKTGCEMTKCNISKHVNGVYTSMSTDTLMIFAVTLDVTADSLLNWPLKYNR